MTGAFTSNSSRNELHLKLFIATFVLFRNTEQICNEHMAFNSDRIICDTFLIVHVCTWGSAKH